MLNSVRKQRTHYGVFLDVSFPEYPKAKSSCTGHSCTCSGALYLFGSHTATLTTEEMNFQKQYQNFYGNFIRHGNPNNWTDNPNQSAKLSQNRRGFDTIEQEPFI